MNTGWIKLHRSLKDHWIWKSENRLKWWLDILLSVNHDDKKILIRGVLLDCKRGQSVKSLESWARDWNVSKCAVRDFFKLLKSDQMLQIESLRTTTRITVCNYECYQTITHTENTQKKRTGILETTFSVHKQEVNNDKNNISEIFDVFRKRYPGNVRGLKTEFDLFIKKNKPEIVHLLLPALEKEISHKNQLMSGNKFVPNWKDLKTWINNRCWEQEFPEISLKSEIYNERLL